MYGWESWAIKKAECQRMGAFELWCWRRLLRGPSTARISNLNPKGNQSWIFIRRTDTETEAPILWLPDVKSQLIRKDLDAGKNWGQEEKGMTKDEMVGWHYWLSGHKFEQPPGDGGGQKSMGYCQLWGRKELDKTEWQKKWVRKILGVGNGNLLLYSCLENDRTWQATVCGVTKIWTWLQNWEHAHTHTHTHTHTHDLITIFLIALGSSFVGLFLFLCILPREVSLAFVAKLI